jgi:hypothetical protein
MPRRRSPAVAIKIKLIYRADLLQTRAGENNRKSNEGKRGFLQFSSRVCENAVVCPTNSAFSQMRLRLNHEQTTS